MSVRPQARPFKCVISFANSVLSNEAGLQAQMLQETQLSFTSTWSDSSCEGLSYIEDSIRPVWGSHRGIHFPSFLLEFVANAVRSVSAPLSGAPYGLAVLCCMLKRKEATFIKLEASHSLHCFLATGCALEAVADHEEPVALILLLAFAHL